MKNVIQKTVSCLLVGVLVGSLLFVEPKGSAAITCGFGTDIGGGVCRGFLVSPTGSNQTFTSPSDWNNSNNTIEVIGAGGSGGASQISTNGRATGGGGGAWSKITNFSFASPGVTTATYQIGTGGTAVTAGAPGVSADVNGNAGGDTWFNSTTFAGSSVGAKGGGGGNASTGTTNLAGGAGGDGASGTGTSNNSGGSGGGTSTWYPAATGAGGAGGSTGAGGNGVVPTGNGQGTYGGAADTGGTGAGIAGVNSLVTTGVTAGGAGTEWDSTHGSGGGGGGKRVGANSATSGNMAGGNYGGGGSSCRNNGSGKNDTTQCTSGPGATGIIVITYTPSSGTTAPTVSTNAATSVTATTATLNGQITATGGADATQSGFAYGTDNTLATVIATTTLGAQTGTASFSSNISNLTCNTTYYSRAYATNSAGTGYGSISSSGFPTSACPVYSISITSSGVVSYGYVALSTASSTVGNGYTQTVQNDGNATEKLNVKSSDATNGTGWTLASSIGGNQFKHEFSTTTGSRWDVMPDSSTYVVANPSVAVSGTTNFDFRLTTPSSSTDYVQKAITITVQAVAP